jgi:hypothetical protein
MEACYDARCCDGHFQGGYLDCGESIGAPADYFFGGGLDYQHIPDDYFYSGADFDFCAQVCCDYACAYHRWGLDDEERLRVVY